MKRVIILQEAIPKYRIPVFSKLAENYDLTVVSTMERKALEGFPFNHILVKGKIIGPFHWIPGIWKMCKANDVVIYMPDMHFINYCLVPIIPHCYKTVSFGIGFRASYTRHYDLNKKKDFVDRVLGYLIFKADAVLVYFKEVLKFWKVPKDVEKKCFETRNTVEVKPLGGIRKDKDTILFVGTLYKEKKVDALIKAYHKAISTSGTTDFPCLEIIGGGKQMDELKGLVNQMGLGYKIVFTGPIYDEAEVAQHFAKALICVSPNQAGLSVPHSLGYGVPFVTTKDAITGGEILHIQNGTNGVLMNSLDDMTEVLTDVYRNKEKYLQMGANAIDYYNKHATIDTMVKGFNDAIQYAMNH